MDSRPNRFGLVDFMTKSPSKLLILSMIVIAQGNLKCSSIRTDEPLKQIGIFIFVANILSVEYQ